MEKTFKMNDVCFHSPSKSIVRVSNGIENNGVFEPTEAVTFRVVGFDSRRPVIAYTYIGVAAADLSHCEKVENDTYFDYNIIKTLFIGRV